MFPQGETTMKANEIQIGGTYQAKVSDRVVTVRIDRENPHGGWDATNLHTNKVVRIKTAGRLRAPVGQTRSAAKAKKTKQKEHHDQLNAKIKAEAEAKNANVAETAEVVPVANEAAENAPVAAVGETKAKKLSALDAAAKVLAESDVPMTCKELIQAMATQGLWSSPKGRTPSNTLYAAVMREVNVKKEESRFRKVSAGHFASNQA
jgi:hypothetical protein